VCGIAGLALLAAACGGGGGGYNGPPTSPTPPPSNATTIQIVSDTGEQAFNPNPSPLPASRQVAWRNDDDVVHRIVANDGSFDTGNLGPGASSTAITVPANGARFHCSLHPTMVGAVNDSGGTTPPCTGLYC
jgi:plastocyanin